MQMEVEWIGNPLDPEPQTLNPIWVVVKIMAPFWGTLNIRCPIIIGIQTGTIVLTTTHMKLQTGSQHPGGEDHSSCNRRVSSSGLDV